MDAEIPDERLISWLNEMLSQARQNAWSTIAQAFQVAIVIAIASILDHPRAMHILARFASDSLNPELLWAIRWSFILAAVLYLGTLVFFFVNSMLHIRAVRALLDHVLRDEVKPSVSPS